MKSKVFRDFQFRQKHLIPILTGILVGTSYIPFPPWALFFCMIPLWSFWVRGASDREILWQSWLCQFVLTLIGFHWVAYTAHEFGQLPWVISMIVLFGFCSFASLHFFLMGLTFVYIRKKFPLSPTIAALLLPALLAFYEYFYPMIFPWNFGYPWLWGKLPGFQLTDLFGFSGLSFLTLLINGFLTLAYLHWKDARFYAYRWAALAMTAVLALNIGGALHRPEQATDHLLRVLVVQANIGNADKFYAEYQQSFRGPILQKFFRLTDQGLAKSDVRPDFILWPETAFPDDLGPDELGFRYGRALQNFVREKAIPLVTGAYSEDPRTKKSLNSFAVLDSSGQIHQPPYSKSILLAFGEYFPGAEYLPFLKDLVPTISDFSRGPGPSLQHLNGFSLGPQICYEGLFPGFSNGLASLGAQLIVNVTNDSWFGLVFEPNQHLYMTLARGVETRRPLVRATNTGISTAITADGKVLQHSPVHEEWTGVFEIPLAIHPTTTFFTQFGVYLPWVLTFYILFLLGLSYFRRSEIRK